MNSPKSETNGYDICSDVLESLETLYLDQLALDVRAATGSSISWAEIIHALIDALEISKVDLTKATSEAEMKAILVENLKED